MTYDPLATPEQRRAVWASIVMALIDRDLDLAPPVQRFEAAHMALDFALLDDPPRDWPPHSVGSLIRAGAA